MSPCHISTSWLRHAVKVNVWMPLKHHGTLRIRSVNGMSFCRVDAHLRRAAQMVGLRTCCIALVRLFAETMNSAHNLLAKVMSETDESWLCCQHRLVRSAQPVGLRPDGPL